MKILIAPDAFKGCLSAVAVAAALKHGLSQIWPQAEINCCPLSDGGEGLLSAVAAARPGVEITCPVLGPQGEALQAGFWRAQEEDFALIEMARASGLSVTRHRRPLSASSSGTGDLIKAALATGVQELRLGAGGSATVDGGAGALTSLGFKFLDREGRAIPAGGGGLCALASIQAPEEDPLQGRKLQILSDVLNPLLGPTGAAQLYAPQKGASSAEVTKLETGLTCFAQCLKERFHRDPQDLPGAGAAGGLAGGLWAALGAEIQPGFSAVAKMIGLDEALKGVDLLLTGEGRVDKQSFYGKSIGCLLQRAPCPVWIFAGEVCPEAESGFGSQAALIPITPAPLSLEESCQQAPALLSRAALRAAQAWTLAGSVSP